MGPNCALCGLRAAQSYKFWPIRFGGRTGIPKPYPPLCSPFFVLSSLSVLPSLEVFSGFCCSRQPAAIHFLFIRSCSFFLLSLFCLYSPIDQPKFVLPGEINSLFLRFSRTGSTGTLIRVSRLSLGISLSRSIIASEWCHLWS